MEPTPTAHLLESIYDIKSWIIPHLNNLHGHSQPHCFKFILNDQGKAVMYFRNWTTSPWCTEEEAAVVLKVMLLIMHVFLFDLGTNILELARHRP